MTFKEIYDFLTIHTAPVYTLAECIAATEHRQAEMEKEYEDCSDPPEAIKERFRTGIYLCNEQELAFLQLAAELSEKKIAWTEPVISPIRIFVHNDFVYLFLHEDQFHIVLPDELLKIYREVTAEDGFAATNAHKLELSAYTAAMINIYGAYEMEHFVKVWNHHHKDKITVKEAMTFLSDRAFFNSDFYFIDEYVVHDCLFDDDFEELCEETEDFDYYAHQEGYQRIRQQRV